MKQLLGAIGLALVLYLAQTCFVLFPQPNPYWYFNVDYLGKSEEAVEQEFVDAVVKLTRGKTTNEKKQVLQDAGMFCNEDKFLGFSCNFKSAHYMFPISIIIVIGFKSNDDFRQPFANFGATGI